MRHTILFVTLAAILSLAFASLSPAAEPLIDTVAGSGEAKLNAERGPALDFAVGQPFGVEWGPDGALYICEVENHRVLRLDTEKGEITTVAGAGRIGYAGDGGPATEALLNEPYEVRFAAGAMFFVEMKNHLVRRVDLETGVISTVAGTGKPGFSGDGGPAVKAQLAQPHSIVLDDTGKLLYIADIGNHRIRRVNLENGEIETIAGTGEKQLPVDGATASGRSVLGPRALYRRGDSLWVALREGHSVWKLDLAADRWLHLAGSGKRGYGGDGGPARAAQFDGPKGITVDEAGNIFVVDTENQVIRRIDSGTGEISTLAGAGPRARGFGGDGGPAVEAKMDRPHGIGLDPRGNVYIGDSNNHRVRRVKLEGR